MAEDVAALPMPLSDVMSPPKKPQPKPLAGKMTWDPQTRSHAFLTDDVAVA